MPLQYNFIRQLWPTTLTGQLLLPWLGTLIAVAVFLWITIDSLADERRDEVIDKLVHVSVSLQTLPRGIGDKPNRDVERILLLAVEAPIRQISIVSGGVTQLTAQRPEHAQAYLNTDSTTVAAPPVYAPTLLSSEVALTYWRPTGDTGRADTWLMMTASLHHINQWRYETLLTAFIWFALLSAMVSLVSVLTVRRSTNVIRDTARFAEALSGNPNSQLTQHTTNVELNRLINALNRISKHWHHRLQLSEHANTHLRMHKVAIDLHSAVCITNGSGRIEYANKHFCIASGYEEKELLGKNISMMNSGYYDDYYFKNLWRTLALGKVWHGELCNRNKRGEPYWVQCTIAPIKDHVGRTCQYIALQTLTTKPHAMASAAIAK